MESPADLTVELFSVVGRFRRQLRRLVGRSFESAHLTESQAELLRLVGLRPGISVSMAAAELGLVPNTASTLVSKLAGAGLLVRSVDTNDRRVCRLRLSEPAQQMVDASRAARRALLTDVLDALDDGQIAALAGGLEVLDTMTRILQERSI